MLHRIAPYLVGLALGLSAPSGAFYGPMFGQQNPPDRSPKPSSSSCSLGTKAHWPPSTIPERRRRPAPTVAGQENASPCMNRAGYFGAKRLSLPEGDGIAIRPRDDHLPGRVVLVIAQRFGDRSDA